MQTGESAPRLRRLRLDIAYDGAGFFGAQVQPGLRTVGSEVGAALRQLAPTATPLTFAGRTDRGVHAAGQVAHSDLGSALTDERLHQALNALLPTDVVITRLQTVSEAFHARYSARWREYRYQVWNASVRHPALAQQTWHRTRSLSLELLEAATNQLIGQHDFAAFAGQGLGVPGRTKLRSTVRTVTQASWRITQPDLPQPAGTVIEFWICADGFLPQMVRTIVSAAVEVGAGRKSPAWFGTMMQRGERSAVPAPAPPQGLSLWQVGYHESDQPSAVSGILAEYHGIGPGTEVRQDDGCKLKERAKNEGNADTNLFCHGS